MMEMPEWLATEYLIAHHEHAWQGGARLPLQCVPDESPSGECECWDMLHGWLSDD